MLGKRKAIHYIPPCWEKSGGFFIIINFYFILFFNAWFQLYLKVTFHLLFLNTILAMFLVLYSTSLSLPYPVVCAFPCSTPAPYWEPLVCSLCESAAFFFLNIFASLLFFRLHISVTYSIRLSLSNLLSILPSRSIHVAANDKFSFLG